MTLLPQHSSPLEEAWVSIDLETTGLSFDNDEIIEVGAVKFVGDKVLDTFQTFVNPQRRLSNFIKRYTGITQADVDGAPLFSTVAPQLATFVGQSPILGHNVAFDMGFLARKGLPLSNPRSDTWDLAFVLHPRQREYSLAKLASWLKVSQPRPHRALDDAVATMGVFLKLIRDALKLDAFTLAEMERLASRSSWVLGYVLKGLLAHAENGSAPQSIVEAKTLSATGLDQKGIVRRLQSGRSLRPNEVVKDIDVDLVESLLRDGSPLAEAIPGFEEREEQVKMARAVAETINTGGRLVVEAGTGVGKSLAYLLPSVLYALANNKRVVVSPNTINLQEQLITKDVPILVDTLSRTGDIPADEIKFTQLKGRANYLCLRRWSHLRSGEAINEHEARMLAKTLVWLRDTETGDRSEINLGHRSSSAPWDRLSAQGAFECLSLGGPCFLRAARERAAASHLVIVNHALLLSDVTAAGTLIPDYDILIIDEAHHLEEEATRHLGFEIGQARFEEYLSSLTGDRGMLKEAVDAFRGSNAAATRRETVEKVTGEINEILPRARENLAGLFASLTTLMSGDAGGGELRQEARVTPSSRAQPGWSDLEILWENVDLLLLELGSGLRRLSIALEGLEDANLINYDGVYMELVNAQNVNNDLRQKLEEFVTHPQDDIIYWVNRSGRSSDLLLHAAPLHVGETLDEMLFSRKESVILTSATLSTNEKFDHIIERTGFLDADELLLGSPFDYPNAAMICVPEDMPEPSSWAYQTALSEAISDAALAAKGRTMALFTSHASLQSTATEIRANLQARGITVLAQGVDGTPNQLMSRFLDNPESVLLGTSSFWEGVDLAGDSLRVLLVARLPFSVPSDPVFAARSELYEDSFKGYAVPQAILRLRQGFGRLIRTKTDVGVAVILDKRIVSRGYGKAFLRSLPPGKFKSCSLLDLSDQIKGWLER